MPVTGCMARNDSGDSQENRAHGHILIGDSHEAAGHRQADAQSPAGGVSSNVTDFARWMVLAGGNGCPRPRRATVAPDRCCRVGRGMLVGAKGVEAKGSAGLDRISHRCGYIGQPLALDLIDCNKTIIPDQIARCSHTGEIFGLARGFCCARRSWRRVDVF